MRIVASQALWRWSESIVSEHWQVRHSSGGQKMQSPGLNRIKEALAAYHTYPTFPKANPRWLSLSASDRQLTLTDRISKPLQSWINNCISLSSAPDFALMGQDVRLAGSPGQLRHNAAVRQQVGCAEGAGDVGAIAAGNVKAIAQHQGRHPASQRASHFCEFRV